MDALTPEIVEVSPADPRVASLLDAHLTLMRASSPACSVHAMEAGDLEGAGARFFAVIDQNEAVAMGAIKRLTGPHGEIKSMRTDPAHLGRGVGRTLLDHILDVARERGYRRLSLETGNTEAFAAAIRLYESSGFEACGPFGGYVGGGADGDHGGFSRYFTLDLTPADDASARPPA